MSSNPHFYLVPSAQDDAIYCKHPKLEHVSRPTVETAAAAYYLNRRPQTLRSWSSVGNGPLSAQRVHGRLAWPVSELKRILGVAA